MIYTNNVRNGLAFEMTFCKLLQQHGFWVHRVTPNAAGQQPCDVIAIKGHRHFLIDCKLLFNQSGGFRFSRVEENQRNSMTVFRQKCGYDGWFAIKTMDGKVRMLMLSTIEDLERDGKVSIPERQLNDYTLDIEEWLSHAE